MIVGATNNNNRCDTPILVQPYSNELLWGSTPIVNNAAIYESYINFLDCPESNHIACFNSTCAQVVKTYTCALSFEGLDADIDKPAKKVTVTIVGLVDSSKITQTKN